MAVSMTGFGSGQVAREGWQCTAELRTVNHRFLDITLRLPQTFQHLQPSVKKTIQQTCHRGKVDCTINITTDDTSSESLSLNHSVAKVYGKVLQEFQEETHLSVTINFSDLLKIKDLIQVPQPNPESSFFATLVQDSVQIALDQLQAMRAQEGESLFVDIRERLNSCEGLINKIEELAQQLPALHYQRLKENLSNMDGNLEFNEERVYQEIALFADRSDVTEEITRFRTHLQHMESVFQERDIGRRADFLLQEFNREINTIASKASHAQIGQLVVEVKGQLEKIREQIQNIE